MPWLTAARRLPAEDAVVLEKGARSAGTKRLIACPILPRIANFDDLDPLKAEPSIDLVMVPPGSPIPAEAALIVLPGSKASLADMEFLRREGWDIDILSHRRRGGMVLGICGGYQMLGNHITDTAGIEGSAGMVRGLGLLDVVTELTPVKRLARIAGEALGESFTGYEMHMGNTR